MSETQAVAVREGAELTPVLEIVPSNIKVHLEHIRQFQEALLEHLQEGHDYAIIPGTKVKSLLQPGAEKVMRVFECRPRYTLVDKIEDWDKPFFYYRYKCELVHIATGAVIGEGEGSCNAREDKYAYRWAYSKDLPKHMLGADGKPLPSVPIKWRPKKGGGSYPVFRIDNEEICSLPNTIAQMSMKRSNVKANRTIGCLSGLFTQDLEDLRNVIDIGEDEPEEPETKKAEAPATKNGSEPATPPDAATKESGADDFVPVTKAMTETVTKFIVEHDAEIKNSADAFGYVKQQFEGRGVKVESMGKLLANKGNRQALLNFLQETYGEIPQI